MVLVLSKEEVELDFEWTEDLTENKAKIKVVGVGGGGSSRPIGTSATAKQPRRQAP